MATAFQTIDTNGNGGGGGVSKKKKSHKSDAQQPQPVNVPALSFPKIGASICSTIPSGVLDHSKLPPAIQNNEAALLPKLKGKPDEVASTTRRSRHSNADEHPPSTNNNSNHPPNSTSLPSVSPRTHDNAAALTVKMLASINGPPQSMDELLASHTARRAEKANADIKSKKEKSTKKKNKKEKKEKLASGKENQAHESVASITNRGVTKPAADDDDDGEYEYDDEEYSSPPSTSHSTAHSRSVSGPMEPTLTSPPAPSAASALKESPQSDPGTPTAALAESPQQQPLRKYVGPSVQHNLPEAQDSQQQACEIGEELDTSAYVTGTPLGRTRPLHQGNSHSSEVEEEDGAQQYQTLTPKSLHQTLDLNTSIQDESADGMGASDENIKSLLDSTPASTTRRHPTSIHSPTLKSPALTQKTTQAKANKKKQVTPSPATTKSSTKPVSSSMAKKKPTNSSLTSPAAQKSASTKAASTVAASPSTSADDNYATDNDWRKETAALPVQTEVDPILQQLNEAAEAAGLPTEMVRFTFQPDTLQQYYTSFPSKDKLIQQSNAASSSKGIFNTTLEFCRNKKFLGELNEGELVGDTAWIPIYSTDLNPSRAPNFTSTNPSTFTVDRSTLGEDPNESLLVKLWNVVYTDGDSDHSNVSTPNSSFNRTLLAEFQTTMKDIHESAAAGVHKPTGGVAPRSALKPSSHNDLTSPDKRPSTKQHHVRFFDHVEVFRLSAPLERTLVVSEEKENHASPAATATVQELSTLVMTEQQWQRRGRGSANAKLRKVSSLKKKDTPTTSAPASSSSVPLTHVRIHARAIELPKMAFLGGTNPQFEIMILVDGTWQSIYKSECQFNTVEPSFKPFVISSPMNEALLDSPILFKFIHFVEGSDQTASSSGDAIGQCLSSLGVLLSSFDSTTPLTFTLTNSARQKLSTKRSTCGQLILHVLPPATPATNAVSGSRRSSGANAITPVTTTNGTGASGSSRRKSTGSNNNSRPSSKQY